MDFLDGLADTGGAAMSGSYAEFDRPREEVAAELGCVAVYPKENQLQIDLDSEDEYSTFKARLAEAKEYGDLDVLDVAVAPSKSGLPKRHVTINLSAPVGAWKRIALQFALGSDERRERISTWRASSGQDEPCVLFELKPKIPS